MLPASRTMIIHGISVAVRALLLFSWPHAKYLTTVAVKSYFFQISLGLPHTKYFASITERSNLLFFSYFSQLVFM